MLLVSAALQARGKSSNSTFHINMMIFAAALPAKKALAATASRRAHHPAIKLQLEWRVNIHPTLVICLLLASNIAS